MKPFADRRDAGRQLAFALKNYQARPHTLVLALPRGGVPVAAEICTTLRLPLDILVVRKLGAPGQPELAMGAIASGGAIVINPEVHGYFINQGELVSAIATREQEELSRREQNFRATHPPLTVADQTILLVDDGAATGASMRVAVQALRALNAKTIVVALPVCSHEAQRILRKEADEVLCLQIPRSFCAVGQWYEEFGQTSDEEVRALLDRQRRA